MRSHGRARVSARNPQAFGICDRCGFLYNHDRLKWQFDWRGASLMNTRVLVCDNCLDVPQTQLRAIVVPADPTPIQNPRVQDYVTAETDYRITQGNTVDPVTNIPVPGGDTRITEDNNTRVIQQTGEPPNGLNKLPGTDWNAPGFPWGVGVPYNNISVPYTGWLGPFSNYTVIWNNNVLWGIGYYNNTQATVYWDTVIS